MPYWASRSNKILERNISSRLHNIDWKFVNWNSLTKVHGAVVVAARFYSIFAFAKLSVCLGIMYSLRCLAHLCACAAAAVATECYSVLLISLL